MAPLLRSWKVATLLAGGILAAWAALAATDKPDHQTLLATADFARPTPVHSAIGLLHGTRSTEPAMHLIAPLRPLLWRGSSGAEYWQSRRAGARFEFVLSDGWGYPGEHRTNYTPPYQDPSRWEDYVRATVRKFGDTAIAWDIWNEPDQRWFWDGTRDQLFETYLRAYRVIRQELGPTAAIGGPSVSRWDEPWIYALLRFCRRHACEVNFVSWHELGSRSSGSQIVHHLRAARALETQSAFAALHIRELQINEYAGYAAHQHPGEMLGFLSDLERGGVDAAALACWPETGAVDECEAPTLDGLLTEAGARRPLWWLLRSYAAGVTRRVFAEGSNPLVVLASKAQNDGDSDRILLGLPSKAALSRAVDISLDVLNPSCGPRQSACQVEVSTIPSGEQELDSMSSKPLPAVRSSSSELRFHLPSVGSDRVLLVTIRRAPGAGGLSSLQVKQSQ